MSKEEKYNVWQTSWSQQEEARQGWAIATLLSRWVTASGRLGCPGCSCPDHSQDGLGYNMMTSLSVGNHADSSRRLLYPPLPPDGILVSVTVSYFIGLSTPSSRKQWKGTEKPEFESCLFWSLICWVTWDISLHFSLLICHVTMSSPASRVWCED